MSLKALLPVAFMRTFLQGIYLLLGMITFYALEKDAAKKTPPATAPCSDIILNSTATSILQLLQVREISNETTENTTRSIKHQLENFLTKCKKTRVSDYRQENSVDRADLRSWLYFSFISITTIGYGDVTPLTLTGKCYLMFYALIGIPLTLWLLSSYIEVQIETYKFLIQRITTKLKWHQKSLKVKLLVTFCCFLTFIGFLTISAASSNSHYGVTSFLEEVYFWFVTYSTIGYGDLLLHPQKAVVGWIFIRLCGLALAAAIFGATVKCLDKIFKCLNKNVKSYKFEP